MRKQTLVISLFALTACRALTPRAATQPLTDSEGGVLLYLQPWPDDAARLSFTIASLVAVRADGVATPLEVALTELPGAEPSRQRLLASGRLPPGAYRGFEIVTARATLIGAEGPSQLLVGKEPTTVEGSFAVRGGRETVLTAALRFGGSVGQAFTFAPQFTVAVPPRPTPALNGVCTNTDSADVTLFDKRRHEVYAAIATGREPVGVVLPQFSSRMYVAVSGEDQIQVQDLVSLEALPPFRLLPGDRPRELALSPDGRLLLVVNQGSNTLAFLEASSGQEIGRVPTGTRPNALLVDRSGRRAYVLNEQAGTITVVDVGTRAVAGTVSTDPSPLRAQLNRDGTRLYVVHGASPQMNVYSIPDLKLVSQVQVGFGASALKVDPRSDLIYVGKRMGRRLDVYDASSLIPIESIDVPGGVSWLTIDDTENTLLALVPARREVVALDLSSRNVLGATSVGEGAYMITVAGERF